MWWPPPPPSLHSPQSTRAPAAVSRFSPHSAEALQAGCLSAWLAGRFFFRRSFGPSVTTDGGSYCCRPPSLSRLLLVSVGSNGGMNVVRERRRRRVSLLKQRERPSRSKTGNESGEQRRRNSCTHSNCAGDTRKIAQGRISPFCNVDRHIVLPPPIGLAG